MDSGVIVMPARTSVFVAMDYYQRGLPLFVPSKAWSENFAAKCSSERPSNEALDLAQQLGGADSRNRPANIDTDTDTQEWHSWPHVIIFENWDDLLTKLDHADLWAIHDMMIKTLAAQRLDTVEKWRRVFNGARSFSRGKLV